jgi:hypothetical protein
MTNIVSLQVAILSEIQTSFSDNYQQKYKCIHPTGF